MLRTTLLLASSILFFIALAAGCKNETKTASRTCEVVGKVLLDGEPLEDAKVVFLPQETGAGDPGYPLAFGISDNKGRFALKRVAIVADQLKQIPHGRYRVIVSKIVDGKERIPKRYNLQTELVYELETEEPFSRPEFDILGK